MGYSRKNPNRGGVDNILFGTHTLELLNSEEEKLSALKILQNYVTWWHPLKEIPGKRSETIHKFFLNTPRNPTLFLNDPPGIFTCSFFKTLEIPCPQPFTPLFGFFLSGKIICHEHHSKKLPRTRYQSKRKCQNEVSAKRLELPLATWISSLGSLANYERSNDEIEWKNGQTKLFVQILILLAS